MSDLLWVKQPRIRNRPSEFSCGYPMPHSRESIPELGIALIRDSASCPRILVVALFLMLFVPAEAAKSEPAFVLIDDFEDAEMDTLPPLWRWKDSDNDVEKPYTIEKQNHNKYLAAKDHGQSVILAKPGAIDINRYPYVSFRWRVHRLPPEGDERYGHTNDSAAAVYIIYKKTLGLIPVSIKYVWSTKLPVGTAIRRSGIGQPWNIVADTGSSHTNEWRTHVFDVREAYREMFGGNPPKNIIGIAVLSDANATGSTAYADYDDIAFLSHADASSGIENVLDVE